MKRLFCLLLAALMVLSMAACGEPADSKDENGGGSDKGTVNGGNSNGENNGESDTPDPTEPPEEDQGPWVLVQEWDIGSSRNKKYSYDENGDLISFAAYDGLEHYRDYLVSYTEKDAGGRIMAVSSKHVQDSEFTKDYEREYDDAGKLLSSTSYTIVGDPGGVCTFKYDDAGRVVEQSRAYEGEWVEGLSFTYDGDLLMEGHYTSSSGSYADYVYTYNEEGLPTSVSVESDYLDYYDQYTLDFVVEKYEDEELYQVKVKVGEDCKAPVGGRTVFIYEEHYDEDGKPYKLVLESKAWGIFHTGWIPTANFGCVTSDNWFSGTVKLVYMPLSAHLAEKE